MKSIDLRSDTFTQPTSAMREAMANAEVGDDVFEEDVIIQRVYSLGGCASLVFAKIYLNTEL